MANTPHYITLNDETKTLTEWVAEFEDVGITRPLVLGRLAAGWTEEEAITTPPRRYRDNQLRITTKAGDG
jgi:hypothetical protein